VTDENIIEDVVVVVVSKKKEFVRGMGKYGSEEGKVIAVTYKAYIIEPSQVSG